IELMGPDHLLVALLELDRESQGEGLFGAQGLPAPLHPDAFRPGSLQRALPGQAGVQRFFREAKRAFCLYVVLGSYARRASLAGAANTLLGGLRIDPVAPGGG
ncbi:MAG: hypothetical protein ACRDYD_00520, partial [Acidimicrobiales bacterium]